LESDCIPRIATGFGGGIGKQGEVCGAVSGGVMVIGLLRGRTQSDDRAAKEAAYAAAAEFMDRFLEANGAIRCRELLQIEFDDQGGLETYRSQNLKGEVCEAVVRSAVRILLDLKEPCESL
jgi:C_GCAxxG_C_C family probable redox protein